MAAATTEKEVCSDLPEELWEHIFKFLNDNKNHYLTSLSLVSKKFLSISNGLRHDLKVYDHTLPHLPHLFQRFPNLTSLDLSIVSKRVDFYTLLTQISTFPLDIKSLILYRKNLMRQTEIFFIVDCFPLLEEFNLTYATSALAFDSVRDDDDDRSLELPKLYKIILSHFCIDSKSINYICKISRGNE